MGTTYFDHAIMTARGSRLVTTRHAWRRKMLSAHGTPGRTVAAYTLLFVGMAWRAQRVFPVAYQWRRVATLGLDPSRAIQCGGARAHFVTSNWPGALLEIIVERESVRVACGALLAGG